MTSETVAIRSRGHPFWMMWSNPIFRRYCCSRLRVRGLTISLLVTVLIAGFIVALVKALESRDVFEPVDAARSALIPLLVIQGVILFVLGTAQVAGGMTAERDEGVIDYQRLIPMSPLSKVLGYLFGLPIREYVMFLATMPFAAWALWRGEVTWQTWLPLYTVVLSSALLYHFTGLLTGTVARNRRWAFLSSIAVVFCLYTVIPQLANFGLVFFKYLTVQPVFEECLPGLLPESAAVAVRLSQRLAPSVKFFDLDFSEVVFTLFSQGGLILTFVVMLCRKWRRTESHLLGKVWAVGFFVWIQVLLLGNSLPLIDVGKIFPSRAIARYVPTLPSSWRPNPMEAVSMSGIYGLVSLVILFILAGIITPSAHRQIQGWRKARKLGALRLPALSDSATSFWAVALMAFAGGTSWFIFTEALIESRWFPGHEITTTTLLFFIAVMLGAGVGYQALLELKGGRAVVLTAILGGAVPLMAGTVLGLVSNSAVGAWLVGMSPITLPVYASASLLSISELPLALARAVPRAFQFWLAISLLIAVWLSVQLWSARKRIAAESATSPVAEPESAA